MLEQIAGLSILVSLILYALMGGADFGGGIWDLLATGPRAARQREAIAEAIGPIWEANHVWLILVVVVLFTGFPSGFTAIMTALGIPITLMLIGIVLRGSAFIFRKYDSHVDNVQRRWGAVFGVASVITPFFQGLVIGALSSGQIRVDAGVVMTGFFTGWLTTFALGCGLLALGLVAFLAATYLTVDTQLQPDLQEDFRRRALAAGLVLAPIAGLVLLAAWHSAPELLANMRNWWTPLLLAATSLCAIGALWSLWRRWFALARIAAAGQVTLILTGWCLAQYPYLVRPDVTVDNAHSPDATLRLLILALLLGLVVLVPSLAVLFYLFKSEQARKAES